MWVPVFESAKLTTTPARVVYWGTPVVLFRGASGRIGALEDSCGHRGSPLSLGVVRGDAIRCRYHHFHFDTEGKCNQIPEVFGVDAEFRNRCGVRRFFVREALGLVWISVEAEATAPFPVDTMGEDPSRPTATGFFPLRGDIRVWMDHFLDLPHGIYVHGRTLFGGGSDRLSRVAEAQVKPLAPATPYPVREWLKFEYHADDIGLRSRLYRPNLLLMMLIAGAGGMRPSKVGVTVDLIAPLCQKYRVEAWSALGNHAIEYWTAINPTSANELYFAYAGYFISTAFGKRNPRNPIVRRVQERGLNFFLARHIGGEDGRVLTETTMVNTDEMNITPIDESVVAMRGMLDAYVARKVSLFPHDSLIRLLRRKPSEVEGRRPPQKTL